MKQLLLTSTLILFTLVSYAQPSSDIWLFSLENGELKSQPPIEVTARGGYDNQPHFSKGKIYYTSQREDQTDIYAYSIADGTTSRVTSSKESEYSPTPTPDGKYISVIMVEKDGTQRLWKYGLSKRERKLVLIDLKPIGYHVWFSTYDLGLFVLGEPSKLVVADSFNGQYQEVAEDIGRTLLTIPDSTGQFSFIKKNGEESIISITDGKSVKPYATLPSGTQDFCWIDGATVVTGVGPDLLTYDDVSGNWQNVMNLSSYGVSNITRIARDEEGKYLAVVIEKE